MTARDLTKQQFRAALDRNGFSRPGFLGYVECKLPTGGTLSICRHNAGSNLRDQLAYLLRVRDKEIDRAAREVRP
jgi:hypothetical protein